MSKRKDTRRKSSRQLDARPGSKQRQKEELRRRERRRQRKFANDTWNGYCKTFRKRLAAAESNLSREANESAKLNWLNEKKLDDRPVPAWKADDLCQLDLPSETLDALRSAGIVSCALLARADALGQLPSQLDQPAIEAALTTWLATIDSHTPPVAGQVEPAVDVRPDPTSGGVSQPAN